MKFLIGILLVALTGHAQDWPGQLGPNQNYVANETNLVDRFPDGGPPVAWRGKVSPTFAPAAVAGGRLFVLAATKGTTDVTSLFRTG